MWSRKGSMEFIERYPADHWKENDADRERMIEKAKLLVKAIVKLVKKDK